MTQEQLRKYLATLAVLSAEIYDAVGMTPEGLQEHYGTNGLVLMAREMRETIMEMIDNV